VTHPVTTEQFGSHAVEFHIELIWQFEQSDEVVHYKQYKRQGAQTLGPPRQ